MTRTKSIHLALVAVLLSPMAANADVIIQIIPINNTSGIDQLHLESFDPTLGKLERVDVSIHAQVFFSGQVQTLAPWQVTFGVDMFGLAGNFFDFAGSGLTLSDSGLDTSCIFVGGACQPITTLVESNGFFDLSFYFTDFAEDIGLNQAFLTSFSSTLPGSTPPVSINGAVSDFLQTPTMIEELFMVTNIGSFANYLPIGQLSVFGFMQIDYEYAEHTQVPEPSTLALFSIGLLGMGLARRRRIA